MKYLIVVVLFCLAGCNAVENKVSSPSTIDKLGLDYSACVGGGFDTCEDFMFDNIALFVEREFCLLPEDVFNLDYSVCFEDFFGDFDVCWEFLLDNDEKLLGWSIQDFFTQEEFVAEIKGNTTTSKAIEIQCE